MSHLKNIKTPLAIIILFLLFFVYYFGANKQATLVNNNVEAGDQGAYLSFAEKLANTNYHFLNDGSRMPAYPFLLSFFYHNGMDKKDFFRIGKQVNIVLSIIISILLFFIFRKYLFLYDSILLLLITMFTVFVFKAGFTQCELLYYFFFFCTFLLMINLLKNPSWKLGVAVGVISGLTFITKASALPIIALFCMFGLLKVILEFYKARSNEERKSVANKEGVSRIISIILVLIFFLITISPVLSFNKKTFGKYLYNVNTTFYIWYDSWNEACRGTRMHNDRIGWPTMPPEQIPTLKKYIKEHTIEQIENRFIYGVKFIINATKLSFGYHIYAFIYSIFALIFFLLNYRYAIEVIKKYGIVISFSLSVFISYFILNAWYVSLCLEYGDRFVLAHFIPFMFLLTLFSEYISKDITVDLRGKQISVLLIRNILLSIILLFDVYFILTERITKIFGGF